MGWLAGVVQQHALCPLVGALASNAFGPLAACLPRLGPRLYSSSRAVWHQDHPAAAVEPTEQRVKKHLKVSDEEAHVCDQQ